MTRVSSIFFWFFLSILTSLALYGTSNKVQDLGKELRALNLKIEAEQANIHVLKAEWVYLANPERIEAAARKYLAMNPTALSQVVKMEDLPEVLPVKSEIATSTASKSTPIANVGAGLVVRTDTISLRNSKNGTEHINTHIVIEPEAKNRKQSMAKALEPGEQILAADSHTPFQPGPVQ